MIRTAMTAAAVVAFSLTSAAHADPAPQRPQPTQQALVQMLQEAQGREAQALIEVYTLRAQIADLQASAEARKQAKPETPQQSETPK